MRIGIGIAAGIVGFVLYGALYLAVFSHAYQEFDLAMRLTAAGMLFSGVSFLAGFSSLTGDGPVLFAKALALPLGGVAGIALAAATIMLIADNSVEILFFGFVSSLFAAYRLVNWILGF